MMLETPDSMRAYRDLAGLTQVQLGALLDVHPLTVSKWERGILTPSTYQRSLVESFARAETNRPGVSREAVHRLTLAGISQALLVLLYHAHPTTAGDAPQKNIFGGEDWP